MAYYPKKDYISTILFVYYHLIKCTPFISNFIIKFLFRQMLIKTIPKLFIF